MSSGGRRAEYSRVQFGMRRDSAGRSLERPLRLWRSAALTVAFLALSPTATIAATSETPRTGLRSNLTYDSQRLNDRYGVAVNVSNGNLVVSASDVQIAGRAGLNLEIGRTYNGLGDSAQATAGRRWTLAPGLDTGIETLADGTRVWHGLTGEVWRFAPATGGGFTSPAAIDARLKVNADGTATITENQSGRRFEFGSGSAGEAADDQGPQQQHDHADVCVGAGVEGDRYAGA